MKSTLEGISDATLFILVTLPATVSWVTSWFCTGWNEGTGGGSCTISALEGVYDGINGIMLLLAFGGLILWLPVVLAALTISAAIKIRAFDKQSNPLKIANSLFIMVPLLILVYVVWTFVLVT